MKNVIICAVKYMPQPTVINLHPNKCSQELHYYPFSVKLNRCVVSFSKCELSTV